MAFENWKRFASGVKGHGVRRVQQSKKNVSKKGSAASSHRTTVQKAKKKAKKSKGRDQAEIGPSPAMEKEWRAESDAHTLMQATEVLESPSRLKLAKRITEKKARQAMEVADNIKKL